MTFPIIPPLGPGTSTPVTDRPVIPRGVAGVSVAAEAHVEGQAGPREEVWPGVQVALAMAELDPAASRISVVSTAGAAAEPRLALTDVSQAYSKLLATVWRVSYGGVAHNGCLHTAYINAN